MKLIVLNYNTGDVDIIRDLPDDIDDLSFFIETELAYNEDEICWMVLNDDSRLNYSTWKGDRIDCLTNNGYEYIDAIT